MFFRDKGFEFLSNMYPCRIQLPTGEVFKCSESAYMAHKPKELDLRFLSLNGFEAKKLGKTVILRADWGKVRIPIMEEILRLKFSDKGLAEKLLGVQGEIVEDNYWGDTFWGRCKGVGENNLGKVLMKIRADLELSHAS